MSGRHSWPGAGWVGPLLRRSQLAPLDDGSLPELRSIHRVRDPRARLLRLGHLLDRLIDLVHPGVVDVHGEQLALEEKIFSAGWLFSDDARVAFAASVYQQVEAGEAVAGRDAERAAAILEEAIRGDVLSQLPAAAATAVAGHRAAGGGARLLVLLVQGLIAGGMLLLAVAWSEAWH